MQWDILFHAMVPTDNSTPRNIIYSMMVFFSVSHLTCRRLPLGFDFSNLIPVTIMQTLPINWLYSLQTHFFFATSENREVKIHMPTGATSAAQSLPKPEVIPPNDDGITVQ